MRSSGLLLAVLCLLLLFAPVFRAEAQWLHVFSGYSAAIDTPGIVGNTTPPAPSIRFPNGFSITGWIRILDPSVNYLIICHGLPQYPPTGTDAAKLKIRRVITRIYDAGTGDRIGGDVVTQKLNAKSCKGLMIPPGTADIFAVTVFKKVKGLMVPGTELEPLVVISQRVMTATSEGANTISDWQYRKMKTLVDRYGEGLR